MVTLICLFWTIWRGRNRAVFEEGAFTTQGLKLSLAYTLWSWTKVYPDFDSCTVNDFLVALGIVKILFFGLFFKASNLYRVFIPYSLFCFLSSRLF